MKDYDVIVVGAGPSGCRTAEIVARKGYSVLVIEEHPEIGKPIQCTGLVSGRIGEIPEEIIINRIERARFYCKKDFFEVKSKESVFVIDREKYDLYRANKAREAGVDFELNSRFLDFKDGIVKTSKGDCASKLLIGADGPNSPVAKIAGLKLPDNLLKAIQVKVKSNFDPSCVELWFGSKVAPGLFAWVVPESEEVARVGLMTDKNPNIYLKRFLKKRFRKTGGTDRTGDVINFGLIEKSVADNTMLVGDAACMVKPFSAGGLVYGQIGAGYASLACIKALKANDFSERFLIENYEKKWKSELGPPIKRGLFTRKTFSRICDSSFSFKLIKNIGIGKLSYFLDMDFLGKD